MTQSRKDAAVEFLHMAAAGMVHEAWAKHVAANFKHHNPYFRGDAHSLKQATEANARRHPHKMLMVQRVIHESDQVVVFSKVVPEPGHQGMAVVHIFRFEGQHIAELWDVGQVIPEISPNENGMF